MDANLFEWYGYWAQFLPVDGGHGTTTGTTQSGNTQTGSQALSGGLNAQGSPRSSSSNNVQSKKKPKLWDAAIKDKVFKKADIHVQ